MDSPLYCLRGGLSRTILPLIWAYVRAAHERCVEVKRGTSSVVHVTTIEPAVWPQHKGRNINMMPFVIGEEKTLPEEFRDWWPIILKCPFDDDERGKVGYLTVQESTIESDQTSQRRAGLHCEAPGAPGKQVSYQSMRTFWGGGSSQRILYGGIYMGSNVSDSCRIHNCQVVAEHIGPLGNVEHLAKVIWTKCGHRLQQKERQIHWLTDRTPHESLPLAAGTKRSFFRVVTSRISIWYKAHSTPNPLCPVPPHIQIVEYNKFEGE